MENIKVTLLCPCAGLSSGFNGRPKWSLTNPNGKLMIEDALSLIDLKNVSKIYFTFLKEHIEMNKIDLNKCFLSLKEKNIFIDYLLLEKNTNSQSETIYETIKYFNIKEPIFIKDCDNNFSHTIQKGNYLVSKIIDETIGDIHNKSFITINNLNEITNICEKNIISNYISVGGYSFESAEVFLKSYYDLKEKKIEDCNELYISHIIYNLLIKWDNHIFYTIFTDEYNDWGTQEKWIEYKSTFKTLFVDIDGTILTSASSFFDPYYGDEKPLIENIKFLQEIYKKKRTQIILTTARSTIYENITKEILNKYEVPYDKILFDLFHCKRYLINDFNNYTNPYPTSNAINIKKNSDTLKNYIK
jgi:hypothetical protein